MARHSRWLKVLFGPVALTSAGVVFVVAGRLAPPYLHDDLAPLGRYIDPAVGFGFPVLAWRNGGGWSAGPSFLRIDALLMDVGIALALGAALQWLLGGFLRRALGRLARFSATVFFLVTGLLAPPYLYGLTPIGPTIEDRYLNFGFPLLFVCHSCRGWFDGWMWGVWLEALLLDMAVALVAGVLYQQLHCGIRRIRAEPTFDAGRPGP